MAVTRWLTQTTMQGITPADAPTACQEHPEEVVDVSSQRSDL
jgi:hypothetical protein